MNKIEFLEMPRRLGKGKDSSISRKTSVLLNWFDLCRLHKSKWWLVTSNLRSSFSPVLAAKKIFLCSVSKPARIAVLTFVRLWGGPRNFNSPTRNLSSLLTGNWSLHIFIDCCVQSGGQEMSFSRSRSCWVCYAQKVEPEKLEKNHDNWENHPNGAHVESWPIKSVTEPIQMLAIQDPWLSH